MRTAAEVARPGRRAGWLAHWGMRLVSRNADGGELAHSRRTVDMPTLQGHRPGSRPANRQRGRGTLRFDTDYAWDYLLAS